MSLGGEETKQNKNTSHSATALQDCTVERLIYSERNRQMINQVMADTICSYIKINHLGELPIMLMMALPCCQKKTAPGMLQTNRGHFLPRTENRNNAKTTNK